MQHFLAAMQHFLAAMQHFLAAMQHFLLINAAPLKRKRFKHFLFIKKPNYTFGNVMF